MADTAYDSDQIRSAVAENDALAVIPNNPSRASKHPLDESLPVGLGPFYCSIFVGTDEACRTCRFGSST